MPAANHEIDEYLETLYHLRERHQLTVEALESHRSSYHAEVLDRLVAQGLVTREGAALQLTDIGFRRAELIVRRHRLAERLLHDVLHMSPDDVERGACEFEHMVAEEITESICILLGHPRTCPHGSPIPPGPCCRSATRECPSAVMPLTELPVGAWARVAYVTSSSDERQHRLMHFNIVPGTRVKLHQIRPSVVILVEGSMLAMEERIARDIFVWRGWREEPSHGSRRRRRRGGLFAGWRNGSRGRHGPDEGGDAGQG